MVQTVKKTIQGVLLETTPVMVGYLVVGMAFGLLLETRGFSVIWAILMSVFIYSGSMQFVCITFLSGSFDMLQIVLIALAMNVRHMVYGLSFIESFFKMGKKRLYMIYSLTDETYSLLCTKRDKEGIENQSSMFLISLFNQCYWIIGSIVGNLAGNVITINTTGIEFAMTALFLVSFTEQWLTTKNHKPALIGLFSSFICLIVFGKVNMILPALLGIVLLLTAIQTKHKEDETTCQ